MPREGCKSEEDPKSLERSACRGGSFKKRIGTLREVYQERTGMWKMGVGPKSLDIRTTRGVLITEGGVQDS